MCVRYIYIQYIRFAGRPVSSLGSAVAAHMPVKLPISIVSS